VFYLAVVGKGYEKIVLFGEHFIEYGLPGVATGIDKSVEVKIDKIKDSTDCLFDDKVLEEKFTLKEKPTDPKAKALVAMFENEFIKLEGIKITINSDSKPEKEMGYSAALCVALVRAMNLQFSLNWKDDKVLEVAFKGELIMDSNASGLDNACATYGSLVWFEKAINGGKNIVSPFKCGKSLLCLLVNTGLPAKIKETEFLVKTKKEKSSAEVERIFAFYKILAGKAKKELKFGGVIELGKLMNENQLLLKQLGVSTPEIDRVIKIAMYDGVLGAKIIGEGQDKVIVLCENEKQQLKLIEAYKAQNLTAVKMKIS
jgi:mevalonate kinase